MILDGRLSRISGLVLPATRNRTISKLETDNALGWTHHECEIGTKHSSGPKMMPPVFLKRALPGTTNTMCYFWDPEPQYAGQSESLHHVLHDMSVCNQVCISNSFKRVFMLCLPQQEPHHMKHTFQCWWQVVPIVSNGCQCVCWSWC